MTDTATPFPATAHEVIARVHPITGARTGTGYLVPEHLAGAANLYHATIRTASLLGMRRALTDVVARATRRIPGITVHLLATDVAEPVEFCTSHAMVNCYYRGDDFAPIRCSLIEVPGTVVDVVATGLPAFEDGEQNWTPFGTLRVDSQDVVTSSTFGHVESGLAAKHTELAGQCAHCGKTRRRSITVLLRNDAGIVRPVGKSCLAEYTGGRIRAELLAALTGLGERIRESFGNLARETDSAPLVDVVAVARVLIERFGFVRAGEGTLANPSTRERLHKVICPAEGQSGDLAVSELTAEQRAAAVADIETIRAADPNSEYMANLQAVVNAESGWVEIIGRGSKLGLLASLPTAADRAREGVERRRAEKAAAAASDHVGCIDEKITVTGTVVLVRIVEGFHGDRTMVKLLQGANAVKFFTTARAFDDVEAGDTITVSATVKDHDEFRGSRETLLVRPKLIERVPAPVSTAP